MVMTGRCCLCGGLPCKLPVVQIIGDLSYVSNNWPYYPTYTDEYLTQYHYFSGQNYYDIAVVPFGVTDEELARHGYSSLTELINDYTIKKPDPDDPKKTIPGRPVVFPIGFTINKGTSESYNWSTLLEQYNKVSYEIEKYNQMLNDFGTGVSIFNLCTKKTRETDGVEVIERLRKTYPEVTSHWNYQTDQEPIYRTRGTYFITHPDLLKMTNTFEYKPDRFDTIIHSSNKSYIAPGYSAGFDFSSVSSKVTLTKVTTAANFWTYLSAIDASPNGIIYLQNKTGNDKVYINHTYDFSSLTTTSSSNRWLAVGQHPIYGVYGAYYMINIETNEILTPIKRYKFPVEFQFPWNDSYIIFTLENPLSVFTLDRFINSLCRLKIVNY